MHCSTWHTYTSICPVRPLYTFHTPATSMPLASLLPIDLFNMYPNTLYVDTPAQANLGNENVSCNLYTSTVGDQLEFYKAAIVKPTTILRSSAPSKVLNPRHRVHCSLARRLRLQV